MNDGDWVLLGSAVAVMLVIGFLVALLRQQRSRRRAAERRRVEATVVLSQRLAAIRRAHPDDGR